eukprot:TRINITY_DN54525_c0_g1_i1.p1 TRINITY_DN54525_c0_g1~~TRINITY_DN54525_c0_g1_i1.p1  ORF type:complete len:351 (-),score=22.51 TRINITY_DN54525_c0_g1_i1:49-945(-)
MARFIAVGTWYSLQMTGDSEVYLALKQQMGKKASNINTPPVELASKQTMMCTSPIYQTLMSPYRVKFLERSGIIADADNNQNVLILGPTGAGKSSIVNLIFNQRVSKVKASALSVTRHMDVFHGEYKCPFGSHRKLNVIDSIGFCDSVIPPQEVLQLVKTYVKTNVLDVAKVVIVCAGRIEHEQAKAIKNLMSWLDYKNHKSEFVFIYNKSENLEPDEKTECLGQMCDLLGADPNHFCIYNKIDRHRVCVKYALALGFPPRARFEDIKDDLHALYDAVFYCRSDWKPIRVSEANCSIL